MTLVLHRFFNHSLAPLRMPFTSTSRVPIEQIQSQFSMLLKDCSGQRAQRVTYRINGAITADELWQLRSELHQCVSQLHSQAEAARRINSLLPSFEGWIPARQRVKI